MGGKLNRTVFFNYARRAPFGGRLSSDQISGMNQLLDFWEGSAYKKKHENLACILANVFHETGGRMVPVRETFAASAGQAIARLDKAWADGKLRSVSSPYWRDGWFGRGRVQTTHLSNYQKIERLFGVNCVKEPDLLLDGEVDAKIVVVGMHTGLWTGKKLDDYFKDGADPQVKASRAIINGKDKASLVESHYHAFMGAIEAADTSTPMPTDVTAEAAKSDDIKATESTPLLASAMTFVTGGGLSVFSTINSPFALAGVALLVVAGLVIFWLVSSGRITLNRI